MTRFVIEFSIDGDAYRRIEDGSVEVIAVSETIRGIADELLARDFVPDVTHPMKFRDYNGNVVGEYRTEED
jgi:hypothetical protein